MSREKYKKDDYVHGMDLINIVELKPVIKKNNSNH